MQKIKKVSESAKKKKKIDGTERTKQMLDIKRKRKRKIVIVDCLTV